MSTTRLEHASPSAVTFPLTFIAPPRRMSTSPRSSVIFEEGRSSLLDVLAVVPMLPLADAAGLALDMVLAEDELDAFVLEDELDRFEPFPPFPLPPFDACDAFGARSSPRFAFEGHANGSGGVWKRG